jgi:ADP-ribose pyrophosphatase
VEILHTEAVARHRWLNLFVRTYRLGGKERQWAFASRRADPPVPASGADAVVIVPLVSDGRRPPRLVLVKEYRVPLGACEYAFPAGLVEPGESVEEAVRRELREETGLEVTALGRVSPPTYSSAGMTDEAVVIAFVTARQTEGGRPCPDEGEQIEVVYLDYEQVCALCDSSERINGRTWPVLYMYQRLGRLA